VYNLSGPSLGNALDVHYRALNYTKVVLSSYTWCHVRSHLPLILLTRSKGVAATDIYIDSAIPCSTREQCHKAHTVTCSETNPAKRTSDYVPAGRAPRQLRTLYLLFGGSAQPHAG